MIIVTGGGRSGGKTAALRELAREWLEAHPGAVLWWRGRWITGREFDRGVRPPAGWRYAKAPDRHAYRAWPWLIFHARRLEWRYRWSLHEWCLEHGLLECRQGDYWWNARPRGWCALLGHQMRLELDYKGAAGHGERWATMRAWRQFAEHELFGVVVLTHARQHCDGRCGGRWDYELVPAIVVRVPLPEPELDACALEGWLPELHAPPIP